MEENLKAIPIFTLKHVNLYRVLQGQKTLLTLDAPLVILYLPSENICSLSIGPLNYNLSPKIPVLRHGKQHLYAFPEVNAYYGVEVSPDTPLEELRTFEKVLKENANFAIIMEQTLVNEQLKCADQEEVKKEPKTKTEKVVWFLTKGANLVKNALVKGAEIISVAIKSGGEYVKTKIIRKSPNPLKIGKTTQALVHGAKEATGLALDLSKKSVLN